MRAFLVVSNRIVIASAATQSILLSVRMCKDGLLRCARNDGFLSCFRNKLTLRLGEIHFIQHRIGFKHRAMPGSGFKMNHHAGA